MQLSKKDLYVSEQEIHKILQSFKKNLTIKQIQPIPHGLSNPVFKVKTSSIDIIIRFLNPRADIWKARKEEWVYHLMEKQKIPVPKILKIDCSKKIVPWIYVISRCLDGAPMKEQFDGLTVNVKQKVLSQLGTHLGRMHSITFKKFGDLVKRGNTFSVGPAYELTEKNKQLDPGPFNSWKEMHRQIVKSRLAHFRKTEFESLIGPIQHYFQQKEHLIDYSITPRLLHLDLHGGNVFIRGTQVTGILDVEESLIGHNEYDLMRCEVHFNNSKALRQSFLRAYTKITLLDEGYEQRRSFYRLSRALVGIRMLALYKANMGAERYRREKKSILSIIKDLLKVDKE